MAPRGFGIWVGSLGNSCWLNAAVQCVRFCPPLREAFLAGQDQSGPLGVELAKVFRASNSGLWEIFAPFSLLERHYVTNVGSFPVGGMANASEALIAWLQSSPKSSRYAEAFTSQNFG